MGHRVLEPNAKGALAIDRDDFFETFSGGLMRAELERPNDMLLFSGGY